ncbi:YceI family protein [Conchiformibius steedae]|uniref:Polyisoprenoid-binding protein n=1 Tax=Conchiformibius steedae TaxID=153493 RepID=A0A3P2AA72_9NEIS|nr:YceI family protein [Conchiformibius steedae]RRD91656.1 polyisoprenoid-binding protein [Conchiformibius steedae]
MKKSLLAASLLALALPVSAAEYTLDPHHTHAHFFIDHFGASTNMGSFNRLSGDLQFDPAKRSGSIDVRLPLANLQTGSKEFTAHLQSADLFHAEKYPEMRFQSTRFHFAGQRPSQIDGKLTILGKTHPVRLKVDKFNCYDSPILKTQVCGADLTTTIDRTRWGMNYLVDAGISKNVRLHIQIEAGKK